MARYYSDITNKLYDSEKKRKQKNRRKPMSVKLARKKSMNFKRHM